MSTSLSIFFYILLTSLIQYIVDNKFFHNISELRDMGKLSLEIKATLENVEEIYTNHPDYAFLLKLKCTSCGESSNKWHDVSECQTFPGKTGRSENNYIAKCKLCSRENCLDIVPGSNCNTNTVWRCEELF